jgi:chloride channel 7
MAYLNGNHVPNLLRARTLITKLVGTICSVSAGFPMGPEGPMVHIGACLASVITYAQCSEWRLNTLQRTAGLREDGLFAAFMCAATLLLDSGLSA